MPNTREEMINTIIAREESARKDAATKEKVISKPAEQTPKK